MSLTLYDYWRSSAAYRLRIALNLKGLDYTCMPVNLLKGEQQNPVYRRQNPQGLVPMLVSDKGSFTQSLAIIEYLEEAYPGAKLLPSSLETRAQARSIADFIACEMHPVNNLRVRNYLGGTLHLSEAQKNAWYQHWFADGFGTLETVLRQSSINGKFCIGTQATIADIFLIPQIYTAQRFHCDMTPYPTIAAINTHCLTLPAFDKARPENHPNAE